MQRDILYNQILSQLEQHKDEQFVFWGASNFLKSFISNPNLKKYNILGIIDNNKNIWNTFLYGYKILSPDILKKSKPICIIDTIINKYLYNYNSIKNVISTNYKSNNIKLLPNALHTYYDDNENSTKKHQVNANFEYIIPTQKEIDFYENLGSDYRQYSEMSDGERLFITSLIQRKKPKKILEVGVAKGGSSFLILNAMNTYKNAKLYSLDYSTECYCIEGKKTGFLIDDYPHLKQNWSLHTGGLALNFLDKIASSTKENEKFDFCFLDTSHVVPGEILEFLQVLPYMKRDSILVLHDTNLQAMLRASFVNNLLMSGIRGQKLLPYPKPYPYSFEGLSNIGAIQLNKTTFSSLYEVFNLLALPWSYMPGYEDLRALIEFFDKHYSGYYSDYFKEVILFQEKIL